MCSQRLPAVLQCRARRPPQAPWAPFEQLWGIRDLANKLSLAQLTNYYADVLHDMERALQ